MNFSSNYFTQKHLFIGGILMSRILTIWKVSRRLGISLSGTGKEQLVALTNQDNTDLTAVVKFLNTECN